MRHWLRPFLAGVYAFFENKMASKKDWRLIIDYELGIWEPCLSEPRFLAPQTFLENRIKFEIFAGACATSQFESDSINWASGIGIGGILASDGEVVEFPSLEANAKMPPWLEGLKSAHRLISFFELLATYIGIRLRAPSRIDNKDLSWIEIPIVTDNLGATLFQKNVYICTTNFLGVTRIGGP